MCLPVIPIHLEPFAVDRVEYQAVCLRLHIHATTPRAACPRCGCTSGSIHSRYARVMPDLPLGNRAVTLVLRARRFYCRSQPCSQRVFCERLPTLVRAHGRRTEVLRGALVHVGVALGGNPGARLATLLGMPASRATLLRLIRAMPVPIAPIPKCLGLDDWAQKRGRTYGTILVDLGTHRVVDLLPDRTADTLAAWLMEHPGVQVISRDRAGAYAEGAQRGAPGIPQVADRFHLMANAGEHFERMLVRHHAALRRAAQATVPPVEPTDPATDAAPYLTTAEQHSAARRARRRDRYDDVRRLLADGHSQRAVAHATGLSRDTVARFATATFPERIQPDGRSTILTPHEGYLRQRWSEGERNAQTLWRELRMRGFTGQPANVRRYLGAWRTTPAGTGRPARRMAGTTPACTAAPSLSPRRARWLLLAPPAELDLEEAGQLTSLLTHCPEVAQARDLTWRFLALVRERHGTAFDDWLAAASASGIRELVSFAQGLRRDYAAVAAALEPDAVSNGQVEGFVNKLKMVKRSMFGRASFDLLRLRMLGAG